MGDHDRGDRKENFCTVPARPPCKRAQNCADYIKICEPKSPPWTGHEFFRYVKAQTGPRVDDKRYEAHHILCVGAVTDRLLGDTTIHDVIVQTNWCINNEDNMMALPLWGHTVKWYCSVSATGGDIDSSVTTSPAFNNLPQHDFDHPRYTLDIEDTVSRIANKVAKGTEDHKVKAESLQGTLKTYSGRYRSALLARGKRKGGTHHCWTVLAQQTPPDPTWCHPFSMASNSQVGHKDYPGKKFDRKLSAWIARLAKGIAGKLGGL
jgi:hypothetical protein